jgi:hypothetical protein
VGVALLFLLILGAVGAGIYYSYKKRQARVAAVAALGRRLGLRFSIDDTERIVSMPFALFARGDGRKVDLVLSGMHNDMPIDLFDFEYYVETRDSRGAVSRSYSRFTCALLRLPVACPHLRVGHEGFFSRIGNHLGLKDVEFEYDDFNRRFRVKCDDQKFAFSLFDGAMMQWMLGADGFETIELGGPYVLLAVDRLAPADWTYLLTWLDQFKAKVPAVVMSSYPEAS